VSDPVARPVLAEYCHNGWHLVPIPAGRKGPVGAGWNRREMCVVDPEVAGWLDGNIGLAHAYSGTCAIDIDDLPRSVAWLAEKGIDLPALLDAPEAVRIESRPGRAKLIYRVQKPLPSFKLPCGLELRCAASSGLTVQDVLPPSIHPDTCKPYEWRYGRPDGHWSKLAPLPPQLLLLWQSMIPSGAAKPARVTPTVSRDAARLRELLATRNPDCGYEDWIAVGMALHHETKASPTGLALWNEWSSAGQKYRGLGDLETHWRSFKLDHTNPKTLASLRPDAAATAEEFPDLTEEPAPAPQERPSPRMAPLAAALARGPVDAKERSTEALRSLRRTKAMTIESRISNIVTVLNVPEISGVDIAHDEFQDAVMLAEPGSEQWRLLQDADYVDLRVRLETVGNCEPVPHEMARQAVLAVADRNRMDTAQIWLKSLEWDGVERIDTFCHRYWGTQNTDYEKAVGGYVWTALAGRIMEPGCQVDMVPVLISKQGRGKSSGVQAMVPAPEHFVELRLDEPDDVIARKTRGVLIAELAEMRGLRGADQDRVKAFITRRHEKWVPKYREFATAYPRRFLIIGTTNDEEFLPPDEEHRRWLPLHTSSVDVAAIKRDKEQLWAEALVRWQVEGVIWHPLDTLAAPARAAAAGDDAWAEQVSDYVFARPGDLIRLHEVAVNAIGLDHRTITRAQELRIGRILRALGWSRITARVAGGRPMKVWRFDPTNPEA
jgi:predicted P-loop ATPase